MIDVDLTEALPTELMALLADIGLVEAVLTDLAESAWLKWRNIAARELHTSRQTYINGIQSPEVRPGERVLTLVGWLPNAIESGIDGFDLRRTLLENPNARARRPILDENGQQVGWYANIPFRHGTPGTTGLAGQPMGRPYEKGMRQGWMDPDAAREFGKQVYAAAKRLRTKGTKRKTKGRMTLPEALAGPKLAEHHSTSIYTGMKRVRKPYVNKRTGKTTVQSQYFTWRRISTTNRDGWMHPGIEPRNFSKRVSDHVAEIAPSVISDAIASALKGT